MGIQLDKSYINAIADCALVDTTTSTYSWNTTDSETILSWLAHSHWDITLTDANGNLVKPAVDEYIRYLDAKLSAVRKTATFWDAYNIRESATTQDEFIQKYAALPNNSSLVVNTATINVNNKTFNRGDIIIKDNYGNQVVVSNEQSGVYMPTFLDDSSANKELEFTYYQTPKQQTTTLQFTAKMPSSGELYNNSILSTDSGWDNTTERIMYSIDAIYKDNQPIYPFWECREYNNGVIGSKIFNLISMQEENKKIVFIAQTLNVPFILIVK